MDSLFPEPLIERLGLTNALSGPKKNRLKTAKIRGEVSQGFIAKVTDVFAEEAKGGGTEQQLIETHKGQDLAEKLGVSKYEVQEPARIVPSEKPRLRGLAPLPPGVPKYEIEAAANYKDAVELLRGLKILAGARPYTKPGIR